MKKIVMLFSLFVLSFGFTSCTSNQVNDAKLKVASKVEEAVKVELTEAFEKANVVVEGVDCKVEAERHGKFVHDKVVTFLKAKDESNKNMMAFTTFKPIVQSACEFAVNRGIPLLMSKVDSSSLCLKKLGEVKAIEYGNKACLKLSDG